MRRFAANYIFTGFELLKNGILIVADDGTILNVINTNGNLHETEGVEFYNGIITPGFINTHCHLELSYLKDKLGTQNGLPSFLKVVMTTDNILDDIQKKAAEIADRFMLLNGIVGVGDIMNSDVSMPVKLKSKIKYHHFFETVGVSQFRSEKTFSWAFEMYQKYSDFQSCSITPHSPYAVNLSLLKKIQEYQSSNSKIFSIHYQETKSENELIQNRSGILFDALSSIGIDYSNYDLEKTDSYKAITTFNNTNNTILLVHGIYANESEIKFANQSNNNLFWVLCFNSNLYVGEQLPDLEIMRQNNCQICIGTDSLASNSSLSIIEELKTITKFFSGIDLKELLMWATINGANALGFKDSLGSFEQGKRPGVNLIQNVDLINKRLTESSIVKVLM